MTEQMSDRERIKAAFRALRKQGFECHVDFQCCQSCGCSSLRAGATRYAFYHRQDARAFDAAGNVRKGDKVHIAFGQTVADGGRVQSALLAAGLDVAWDGSAGMWPAVLRSSVLL